MDVIAYDKSFGACELPEEAAEKLRGKSLTEQMECFQLETHHLYIHTGDDKPYTLEKTATPMPLAYSIYCKGIIVKDGILVGVLLTDFDTGKEVPCFLTQSVCVHRVPKYNYDPVEDLEDWMYLELA